MMAAGWKLYPKVGYVLILLDLLFVAWSLLTNPIGTLALAVTLALALALALALPLTLPLTLNLIINKARKELVLGALNTLFDSSVEEEVRVRFSPNPNPTHATLTRT